MAKADAISMLGIVYLGINYLLLSPILWYYLARLYIIIKNTQSMDEITNNNNKLTKVRTTSSQYSENQNNPNPNNPTNFTKSLIQIRSPFLIYTLSIVTFIGLFIERPLLCIYRVLQINIMPSWLSRAFGVLYICAILILLTIKAYHLYFKQKYNMTIAEYSWRTNINPNWDNWYFYTPFAFLFFLCLHLTPYHCITILIDSAITFSPL